MPRSTPPARLRALMLLLLLGLTAACSGTGTPGAADDREAASTGTATTTTGSADVAAELSALFARLSPESAGAADCFGAALSADLGDEELREAGLLDGAGSAAAQMPSLDRGPAGSWVDAWFGCVDFVSVVGRAQAKATRGLDEAGFRDCLRDALDDEELRSAAVDGLAGDAGSESVRRLGQAQATCADRHS
ncbi:hypothetical protein [Nocardioides donggukensis]|uniref:DUF732 domain-containing protein n=1 Tax=Nocardioides donggukensis TaxID=2774019 RepID=A0A927KBA0_9ACTN|nr:hypothetical protein [Nocardioides donggukensis]MBD8871136.1 hypothetical protein [Nocardioides donggukensis]